LLMLELFLWGVGNKPAFLLYIMQVLRQLRVIYFGFQVPNVSRYF
jgi:hypothetical protein